jgi:hypothetical protein
MPTSDGVWPMKFDYPAKPTVVQSPIRAEPDSSFVPELAPMAIWPFQRRALVPPTGIEPVFAA